MERRVIFWLFLVQSYRVQSSDPPVFVQKGKDVLLEVNNVPEKFDFFIWKFGKNSLILVSYSPGNKPAIGDDYTGRIDFSETNKHSVILKNLQETDSGVYNAQVITRKGQFTLVQHHIIVQDVVSPVMLEVNSVSNSSDSCNITLTCSAVDSHINSTFRCVNQKCVQDGGNQSMITKFNASLNVYLMNDLVICNHSNQVSSTENKMDIQHVCPQYAVPGPKRNHIIGPAVGGGVFVLVLIAAVSMHLHHKKKQNMTPDSTIYACPVVDTTNAAAGGGQDPGDSTIYSLVKPHDASPEANGTVNKPLPDSLYAQIEKVPVA